MYLRTALPMPCSPDTALLGAVHRAEKIPVDKRINPQNMIQRIEDQER